MEIRQGIGVVPGYAIGPALVLDREEYRIERRTIPEAELPREAERLTRAFESAIQEISRPLERKGSKLGPAAEILKAHITLLQDQTMRDEMLQEIRRRRYSAEYSASRTIRKRIKALSATGHHAFVERVVLDLNDLEQTLLRSLLAGKCEDLQHLTKPVILVAHNLSPTQTFGLDRTKILGIATEAGGRTSHTAIVAASIGIPAVVGVEEISSEVTGGDEIILDGGSGRVILNPDEGTRKRYQAMERNYQVSGKRLARELHDQPAETKDGHRVSIVANIESPDEIQAALNFGAEGIGMYRSEFLYLQHQFQPTEEHHLEAYRKAVQALAGRRLVIRTLDLGADKMPLEGAFREDNPFLGIRAIRLCLAQPEMFKTQLRAILKVAAQGNVSIMYPMVSSLQEIHEAKELVQEVRRGLIREGFRVPAEISTGIMVEVPSAALTVDILAPHVDFLSIGTNDLIAYSIAVDRGNERVAPLFQPAHPAVLRMLKTVIETGEKLVKPVSICGEMSSDLTYVLLLLGMGLKIFSVVPPAIPEIKKIIRSVTLEEARAVAKRAFEFTDPRHTTSFLREETRKILPEAF